MATENQYKVRLTPASSVGSITTAGGRSLSFDASPTVSESRTVNYNSLDPLHAPGQIQVYKNTSSRTFQISDIKLISRTIIEADRNLEKLWKLRSWCMPRFGNSSTLSEQERSNRDIRELNRYAVENQGMEDTTRDLDFGNELLGAPPPVLYLSAYSKFVDSDAKEKPAQKTTRWNEAQHINRVPTVIQQLTIPYPNDIDYITTTKGVPMPIIMNIDITLIETHSPNAYESFNLNAFKEGRLAGF